MSAFERRLRELVAAIGRDPRDAEARVQLHDWIDGQPEALLASLPDDLLRFGIAPEKLHRRVQFVKQLLLHGYLPPRIEDGAPPTWNEQTVNFGVITGYFYPHALSLLEAGLRRSDLQVLVSSPSDGLSGRWVEIAAHGAGKGVHIWTALMLDEDGLALRRFKTPVPVHYLMPIDNYYRSKFRLVTEFGACDVPMPGSLPIREVCENKLLLTDIAGDIPGLRLARELQLRREDDASGRAATLDRFCAQHNLTALVSKPVDAFGGIGIEFWRYPEQRQALLQRLDAALAERPIMLVQERIVAVPTVDGREWNLRQYVLRGPGDTIESRWKRGRIGHGAINTTQGAQSIAVENLLPLMRLDAPQRAAFEQVFRSTDRLAAEVMRALDRYMERHWADRKQPYQGSGSNLEADLLALDFMIAPAPGTTTGYVVYLNEINDFASGGMRDYEVLAHRQALPDADRVVAAHSFSLARAMLETAKWRGDAYRQALLSSR
jgi:hypothetical protein